MRVSWDFLSKKGPNKYEFCVLKQIVELLWWGITFLFPQLCSCIVDLKKKKLNYLVNKKKSKLKKYLLHFLIFDLSPSFEHSGPSFFRMS